MKAGLLKEVITIIEPRITKDSYGATQIVWDDLITTRADVEFNTGSRDVENDEIINNYTYTFRIRRYHLVKEQMRIKWRDSIYRILSIYHDRDKQMIVVKTELVNE